MSQPYDFEKRTFENLCHFYRTNLHKILKGGDAYKVLNSRERNRLRDAKILINRNGVLRVSEEAKNTLLNSLE